MTIQNCDLCHVERVERPAYADAKIGADDASRRQPRPHHGHQGGTGQKLRPGGGGGFGGGFGPSQMF